MRIAAILLLVIGFGAPTDVLAQQWDSGKFQDASGVLRLDLDRTAKYGCTVDDQPPYFRTVVWADYKDSPLVDEDGKRPANAHDYAKVYSMRDTRRKALNDCDKWLNDTAKEIAQERAKASRK